MTEGPDALPLLQVEDLTVRRQGQALLDGVALRLERGTIHALIGPNGAGKSTFVSALLGLISFDGRIALNWVGAGSIGYVPQSFIVDRTLPVTVAEFLALTRQRRPVCLGLAADTRRRVAELLERVGLPGFERRPLSGLSGGELRRVLLAHALDPEPELLLLDEPNAGLDETAMRILDELLVAARRTGRVSVLMVSHDLPQVERIADRVTVLDRRVLAEGAPGELTLAGMRELMPYRRAAAVPA